MFLIMKYATVVTGIMKNKVLKIYLWKLVFMEMLLSQVMLICVDWILVNWWGRDSDRFMQVRLGNITMMTQGDE